MAQGLSSINSYIVNPGMNAQMPSPNVKQANENKAVNVQNNVQPKTTEQIPQIPPLNVGVVNAPATYPKTPVTDSLTRRAEASPRTVLKAEATNDVKAQNPVLKPKKQKTLGDVSAFFAIASFSVISAIFIPRGVAKLIKLIRHK